MIEKLKNFMIALFQFIVIETKNLLTNKLKFYQHIVLLNVIVYIVTHFVLPMEIVHILVGHSFQSDKFEIWQPLTYMFIHGGFWHIFINMLVFWSMAGMFEKLMSKMQFIALYFIAGFAGYVCQFMFSESLTPIVGASGAIFGFLASAIILTPNQKFHIIFFPFIGIKAKWLISIGLITELVLGITSTDTGIGHMCHFGGGIAGIIIAGFWITKKMPNFILRR